jgi:hypothetical protein
MRCVRWGGHIHAFRCQKLPPLLHNGEQLRHKHCRDELHVEFIPYNLQIHRQIQMRGLTCQQPPKWYFIRLC